MARMLGTYRQPPCKRCCGDRFKDERKVTKRAVKRAEKADLRRDIEKGRV
ncbi:hypothetical protein MYRNA_140 [Mycobacterium phage Myrna]|uniref:Uncharacterized protein n=1 Tax=Mycobacterium phage Myrna TaxID=546805 RepID=B5LJE4_9CAUD|nr:gp140 [Mycobacterium phage Myrna]ACH62141.1 hypothetical protein MYRNA_140 [Mycobacterium phage Myrna]